MSQDIKEYCQYGVFSNTVKHSHEEEKNKYFNVNIWNDLQMTFENIL